MAPSVEHTTSLTEGKRALVSFGCAVCVAGMAAIFWFVDDGLFHYVSVLPALIAALLVYNGFHSLLASPTPATTIRIPSEPLRLGGKALIRIRQAGPVRLKSLRANLICERIDKETDNRVITYPCQLNFFEARDLSINPNETKEFQASVVIPADGEASCQGVSLDVLWRIEIWGKVAGRPGFMRPFDLEVAG